MNRAIFGMKSPFVAASIEFSPEVVLGASAVIIGLVAHSCASL